MHDALAGDVVRQAAKRLEADDIWHTLVDELDHLARQEPAFACHVAEADMARGELGRLVDLVRCEEVAAVLEGLAHRRAVEVDDVDEHAPEEAVPLLAVEQPVLDDWVVGRVEEEVDEVRHDDLRALLHQDLLDVVVRDRMVLREDLADNADFRLPEFFIDRDIVEFLDNLLDRALELEVAAVLEDVLALCHPLVEETLRLTLLELIRHHAILDVLQEIAEDRGLDGGDEHRAREAEGIRLFRQAVHGEDRHLREARVLEGLAQDAHVIRRAAGTAGLEHRDARVVGVVLTRLQRGDELADDDDGRVAHVVVDVAQAEVDGRLVRHLRHDEIVAIVAHDRLDELEVYRGHLRCENRVRLLALRGEVRALDWLDFLIRHGLAARERGHQGTQADAGGAEVRDFIELDHRVDAVVSLENVLDLPRRQRIEAAAERAELDQREVRVLCDELRRMVEARVVTPLVDDLELRRLDRHVVDGVFRDDGQMVALDHLRDAVVDLRVDVIGATDEHDDLLPRLLDALEDLGAVVAHILAVLGELLVGLVDSLDNLLFLQTLMGAEFLVEARGHALLVVDWQERLQEVDVLLAQDVHVAADVLSVRSDNRAVVVVLRRMLVVDHVVGLARVEDLRDALLDEVHDVAVCNLGRVAERVGRHRRHALEVHLRARLAREHDAVAELREEREPERVVLVHVEHARQADRAAHGLLERLVVLEQTLVLVLVDVRRVGVLLLAADAALAAVAREVLAAVRELLHRDQALVAAAAAAVGARRDREMVELIWRQQARLLRAGFFCGLHREDGRTVGAHQARDIGADDVTVQEFLHAAQHGVVVECAALHDDVVAELADILELHDLEERILDDGERDAGRDVGDVSALFLRLLDLRVHEDRAARAEVYGGLRVDGFGRELRRRHVQALGEVLDEGAAAGRARFVERDVADTAVLDEEALHVLAADVEHEGDIRAEFLCRPQVCERLDLAAVSMQGSLDNGLTIARRHRARNLRALRQRRIEALHLLDDRL